MFDLQNSCLESESDGFLCAWSGFQVGESTGEAPKAFVEVGEGLKFEAAKDEAALAEEPLREAG